MDQGCFFLAQVTCCHFVSADGSLERPLLVHCMGGLQTAYPRWKVSTSCDWMTGMATPSTFCPHHNFIYFMSIVPPPGGRCPLPSNVGSLSSFHGPNKPILTLPWSWPPVKTCHLGPQIILYLRQRGSQSAISRPNMPWCNGPLAVSPGCGRTILADFPGEGK